MKRTESSAKQLRIQNSNPANGADWILYNIWIYAWVRVRIRQKTTENASEDGQAISAKIQSPSWCTLSILDS